MVKEELNSIPTPAASTGEGVLSVDAVPWAELSLDGKALGTTPREMRLGAGSYVLTATNPTLGSKDERVTVVAGKRLSLNVKFAQ
jgi:hypothetical protein